MIRKMHLGDLGDIFIGLTYKPDDVSDEGMIVLRSGNIQDGNLDFDDLVRVNCTVREGLLVKPNDILMCTRNGSARLVGKCTLLPQLSEEMTFGAFMTIIRTPHNRYLRYFFDADAFRRQIKGSATTTINQITRKMLDEVVVPIPEVAKMERISMELDKVSDLIAMRKKQLQKLDDLVKSRFVEMFGDQETNPYNLDIGKLSDVADIYLGLTHTPTYVEQGRPFLSVRDISSGVIDFSNCHYITEEEFGSLPNGARPKAGDMLFCRVGTIGKPVIIPENTPEFGTFVSVGYLRKKTNVNNYYLKSWMEHDYFMQQVYDNVSGASQINLNTGWLKNFRILIPSIELQNQFATFVEQTEKLKSTIQQSLDKLELLKKALMQKYFG